MQKRLQVFIEWLFDNLFDFATIVVAGYLVVRYQVQPPSQSDIPEITTWILGVLGLIAVSGLWERNRRLRRIEKLSEESRNLAMRSLNKKVYTNEFFLSEPRLTPKELSSANVIYLGGRVLTRTISEVVHILKQRLETGATLRLMVLDPGNETVLQQLSLRSINAPPEFWLNGVRETEQIVRMLAESVSDKGKVELGYLPYVPSFGLILVDPNQPHGFGFVEIYPHRSIGPHPTFRIQLSDDPYWFNFFKEQFERMWQSCRVKDFGGR